MNIEFILNLKEDKKILKCLEVDNTDFAYIKDSSFYVKVKKLSSLKNTLDDFFRCYEVAKKIFEITKDIKIRNVDENDLKYFLELYFKAYEGFDKYYYKTKKWAKWYFNWLLKRDKEGFFVLEYKNRIVGFLAVDCNWVSKVENKKVAEIHEIFIHPDFRKKGFGKILIDKAIEYAKKRGRDIVELWVGEENFNAIKFYESLGFKKDIKIKEWIRMYKHI
ncbi:KEOPS complex subunit Pcc1 [Methanocaldococcus indicus]|uniref:KEOPS complex subunit Pcc1 n=1 Tax=Methanocaldococcus indicus TaxID=213231 RepID=UPI003C6D67C5